MSTEFEKDPEGETYYHFLLSNCLNVGRKTYDSICAQLGSVREVFLLPAEKLEKTGVFNKGQIKAIRKIVETGGMYEKYCEMKKAGISYVCCQDILFPQKLKEISDCPTGLFYIGRIPFENVGSIGLVGARECSFYGEEMAGEIGMALGDCGLQVISGMARGVDSLGQTACLDSDGLSYAILGGGVDVCYPRESRMLYKRLRDNGGIISEYPPGVQPQGMFFVRRNRIISGLSDLVCVIEARKKSGTLITVDFALEQGKDVVAVPGKITDVTSRGCNELIAQGARILCDVEEFAKECAANYGSLKKEMKAFQSKSMDSEVACLSGSDLGLSKLQRELLLTLSEESFNITDKLLGLKIDYGALLVDCLDLCDKKLMINMGAGRFRLSSLGMNMREYVQNLEIAKKN